MTSSVQRLTIASPRDLHHATAIPPALVDRCSQEPFLTIAPEEIALRETLKRCKPAVIEAALEYRKTGDAHYLPGIIHGIIERYVERDLQPKLNEPSDGLRLVEDLGIDSLTMMEIVLLAEDVLKITIDNDDLLPLRTVGDIKRFVASKVDHPALSWPRDPVSAPSPL